MSFGERVRTSLLDAAAVVATAGTAAAGLLRGRRGRIRDHIRRRGLASVPAREEAGPCLWLHGVSVGEVLAARGLVRGFVDSRTEWDVVVSASTKLGLEAARNAYPDHLVVSFPLDLSGHVQRALARLRPSLVVIVEHDLWPNFLRAAAARNVPVILINARLSERSAGRYRVLSRLIPWPPGELAAICAQDRESADRFVRLGYPAERIRVTGNLKFDNPPPDMALNLRTELGYADSDWVLVAGSTHEGEEEVALEALREAREQDERSFLILAPRRTERVPQVARLISERGFRHALWSSGPGRGPPVLLVDTMGELASIYAAANVVFVGGTVAPIGGHSVIEPAGLGRPIVIGPHYHKARGVVEGFRRRGAIEVADSGADAVRRIGSLRTDPDRARDIGARARRTVEENLGATVRTQEVLEQIAAGSLPG
jgi:3-deoxy-D-manno-octulosonic-acid transferase